jgi:2-methylaconitate cis-trans-isomerase PrpF
LYRRDVSQDVAGLYSRDVLPTGDDVSAAMQEKESSINAGLLAVSIGLIVVFCALFGYVMDKENERLKSEARVVARSKSGGPSVGKTKTT